ncbi:MAG: hypothetical protein M0P44_01100 [Clostridiales bacterium]|nr:hypothetical protein [Clostridiales bacterium]
MAGRQTDVKAVNNAYEAYENMMRFNPYAVDDFLKARELMMQGLVEEAGTYRSATTLRAVTYRRLVGLDRSI